MHHSKISSLKNYLMKNFLEKASQKKIVTLLY